MALTAALNNTNTDDTIDQSTCNIENENENKNKIQNKITMTEQ